MRLELKLLKFMIGKESACQRRQERSVRFQVMNYFERCGERQRLHYLFIWALYNIVNCDVLKWIQIWGRVMRTYWISARGRLNPPGSPHISHPALPLPSWHSGGEVTSPPRPPLWRSWIKPARCCRVCISWKREARTRKQLLRAAPTPIKLNLWKCPLERRRDAPELKHNTAWSVLNRSWMQELADEQSLPCL